MEQQTKRKVFTKNFIMSVLHSALIYIGWLFMAGSIIQTVLNYFGVSAAQIGSYTATLNIVALVVTLLGSPVCDKAKNAPKTLSKFFTVIGVAFIGYLPLGILGATMIPAGIAYLLVFVLGSLQTVFYALRDIVEFKLPYQIIDMRDYPLLVSVEGIVSGTLGIILSVLLNIAIGLFPYQYVVLVSFILGGVFTLTAAFITHRLKIEFGDNVAIEESAQHTKISPFTLIKDEVISLGKQLKTLIHMESFTALIIPNFLRGICTGVFSMAAVLAIKGSGFTEQDTSLLTMMESLSYIVGALCFAVLSRKFSARKLCFVSSLILLVTFPFMSSSNKIVFLVSYFLSLFVKIWMDYGIPTAVARAINFDIAGSYHAWRLLIMSLGSALSSTLVGALYGKIPTIVFLIVGACAQLGCGIGFGFAKCLKGGFKIN